MKVIPSCLRSLPVWGAWVEKDPGETTPRHGPVAPRMGSEGRKSAVIFSVSHLCVAPRMGSEDRNMIGAAAFVVSVVAPRMGSEDRNTIPLSPPPRILAAPRMGSEDRNSVGYNTHIVSSAAPRMGSVDRSMTYDDLTQEASESLPAWGAWVEVPGWHRERTCRPVAPRVGERE